ncbi:MAG: hypothetical protein HKN33_07820 [Pyrinomonadaceae bacterium]|nr:hypothetical protein [Flavobacteriales bacterium]NNE66459.1 hypothetical protein [Pyrinomonadaceae bacterium]
MAKLLPICLFIAFGMWSCAGANYSFSGTDTSGAQNFSVDYFKAQTPQASQLFSQRLTESFKTLVQEQSPLDLTEGRGQLHYEGSITGYQIKPVAVEAGVTSSLNRLTVRMKVKYQNSLDPDKSFDKVFEEYTEYESSQDFFSIEESLWEEIFEKLGRSIYNESLGNW